MSTDQLSSLLVSLGLIDPSAINDPEGYDNYRTHGNVAKLAKELNVDRADLKAKLDAAERCCADMREALRVFSNHKSWTQCESHGGFEFSDGVKVEDGEPFMAFSSREDHPWTIAKNALREEQ